jgi:fatty acid desaturase
MASQSKSRNRTEMSDQSRRQPTRPSDLIEPVQAKERPQGTWTEYLVLFLRMMAVLSLVKGLYHWAQVCGIGAGPSDIFEMHTLPWQTATVFFAIIDLVAAVGLWLAAAWGAVVWLTSVVSMAMVEVFFPTIYGGSLFVVLTEAGLLGVYLWLAIHSARERPA